MTVVGRIEIGEIDHLSAPRVIRRVTPASSLVNRSRLVGLCGTLILHGSVALMFIAATPFPAHRPINLAGASAVQSVTASADELVLLTLNGAGESRPTVVATTIDLRSQLTQTAIPLVTPDQPVIELSLANADPESSGRAQANAGDPELQALMVGRYTGQISARIERAWERPRSPVNDLTTDRTGDALDPDTFVCRVKIRQDDRGDVQEVLLLACNGTEAWRHSLVIAINQSSPLPAPPIPGVFQRALTMSFVAQQAQHDTAVTTRK